MIGGAPILGNPQKTAHVTCLIWSFESGSSIAIPPTDLLLGLLGAIRHTNLRQCSAVSTSDFVLAQLGKASSFLWNSPDYRTPQGIMSQIVTGCRHPSAWPLVLLAACSIAKFIPWHVVDLMAPIFIPTWRAQKCIRWDHCIPPEDFIAACQY